MTERPIIFSSPMIKALIAGRKTQTRRIAVNVRDPTQAANPYGKASDKLWVKETWRTLSRHDDLRPSLVPMDAPIEYNADNCDGLHMLEMSLKWRTSLFMPKKFSRIKLELSNVRLEQLLSCSAKDAIAEGIEIFVNDPIDQYSKVWETIHGKGSWLLNPWVWVIEFKVQINGDRSDLTKI